MILLYQIDRDECKDGGHNCSKFASCLNTEGSFVCTCLPVYVGDGITCKGENQDITSGGDLNYNRCIVVMNKSYTECHMEIV